MKGDGNFVNWLFRVFPAKDAPCTSRSFNGHFATICISKKNCCQKSKNCRYRFVYPSDQPVLNNQKHDYCCGVKNAWSETRQRDNKDYLVINVTKIRGDDGK